MKETDVLRRFVFEQAAVRGVIVHLDASWRAVCQRADYPPRVAGELGQFLAASVLLSSTLKFDGSLVMQIQGNGPIGMMVVEVTSRRTVRGLAHWREEALAAAGDDLAALYGDGRLVMTIDNRQSQERYQGIVALEGGSLAAVLENYLRQSEQLDTCLWLAIDGEQATGMLLQRLPAEPEQDGDAWNRIRHLAATLREQELTGLSAEEILHRLFHEESLRLFDAEPVSFRCSCSRERVGNMLRSLGLDEVRGIIAERELIEVHCEFCNQAYRFDAVDAEALFAAEPATAPGSKRRH